jgi:hypothetical protein
MGAENEGKCLDAVLKVIEGQHRETRKILERDTPTSRGIELLCNVGRQRYAFEHTLIEPFPTINGTTSHSRASSMKRLKVKDEAAHDRVLLIRDVRVIKFDYEAKPSSDYSRALLDCQNCLSSGDAVEALNLWERLVGIADEKRPAG